MIVKHCKQTLILTKQKLKQGPVQNKQHQWTAEKQRWCNKIKQWNTCHYLCKAEDNYVGWLTAGHCIEKLQRTNRDNQWAVFYVPTNTVYRVGQIQWHHFTFLLVTNACIN